MKKMPINSNCFVTDNTKEHNVYLWLLCSSRGAEKMRFMPFSATEWHIRHIMQTVDPCGMLVGVPRPWLFKAVKMPRNNVVYPNFYTAEKQYKGLKKALKCGFFGNSLRKKVW